MASEADYGAEETAMQRYFEARRARALALDNRGPIRFDAAGRLAADILDAYDRHGFYVFENAITPAELAELRADYDAVIERLPSHPGSDVDRHGRPALGADLELPIAHWGKPLSDPAGGSAKAGGRHPVKMFEPRPAEHLPEQVVFTVVGPLQFSEAFLRLSGHPDLLRIAASLHGDDFVPFQEGIIIKRPGEGRSFSWHQDGTVHWDNPAWHPAIHGTNYMTQLFGSTPANGVWFVPGTHKQGKLDIAAMVAAAGSERLPDAVPLVCNAGDVTISNRQILHGSFANTSPDIRVTMNMGFHARESVLGVAAPAGFGLGSVTYDDAFIARRAAAIGYAIAARRAHFPDETPYDYRPHAGQHGRFAWPAGEERPLRDYNKFDLRI